MAEENPNTVNLDLNLGLLDNPSDSGDPHASGSRSDVAMNLEDWLHTSVRGTRQRSLRWRSLRRHSPLPTETRILALELIGDNVQQTGEGRLASEEIGPEQVKVCEGGDGYPKDEALCNKDDSQKNNGDEGSIFYCNICLDLGKDPVVTSCGHLFCWPCIYRWIHPHSDARECPVCKGEVTTKNLTPIYGRGNNGPDPVADCFRKIPPRPQARRIESWRQAIQRASFSIPMEEMIRRLGGTFEISREQPQMHALYADDSQESPERSISLLNRILTSRGMRREQPAAFVPSGDVIDLAENSPPNRLSSLSLHRTNSLRAATTPAMTSAESLVESYFYSDPVERNQDLAPFFDDRDSVSSIAAIMQSDNHTVDSATDIDSRLSLSTSSSRRRNDTSRIPEVDGGDSRALRRRRRLN